MIYDHYTSEKSQVKHIHIRQKYVDIEIYNAVANFNFKEGKLLSVGNRLQSDIANRVNTTQAILSPADAVLAAAEQLGIPTNTSLKILEPVNKQHFVFEGAGISLENIPVKLMFQPVDNENNEIRLAWDLSI